MSAEDLLMLQTLLQFTPLCLDSLVRISSPFTVECADGLVKCIGKRGRIAAYAPDFDTAIAKLTLEILRDENPLTRYNYG
jgi:hypothetical protein